MLYFTWISRFIVNLRITILKSLNLGQININFLRLSHIFFNIYILILRTQWLWYYNIFLVLILIIFNIEDIICSLLLKQFEVTVSLLILNHWTSGIKLIGLDLVVSLIKIWIGNNLLIILIILLETELWINLRLMLQFVIH